MHTHLYGGLWETRAIQKLWERTSTLYVLRSTGCAEMERRQAHRHAGRDAEDAARRGEHQRQHEADVAPAARRAARRRCAALLSGACTAGMEICQGYS